MGWTGPWPRKDKTVLGSFSGRLSAGVTEGPGKDLDRRAAEVWVWGEQAGHQLKCQQRSGRCRAWVRLARRGWGNSHTHVPFVKTCSISAPVLYCQHAHFSDIQSFKRSLDCSERKYGKTNKQHRLGQTGPEKGRLWLMDQRLAILGFGCLWRSFKMEWEGKLLNLGACSKDRWTLGRGDWCPLDEQGLYSQIAHFPEILWRKSLLKSKHIWLDCRT